MVGIVIGLLVAMLLSGLAVVFSDDMMAGLVETVFYMEKTAFAGSSINLSSIGALMLNYAVAILILKFLKKGFDIYVGWYDGDKDADPLNLVINFIRAMVAMFFFNYFYKILADLVNEVVAKLLVEFTDTALTDFASRLGDFVKDSIGLAILGVVLVVMIIVLYIKFFKYGAELFIMRIFFPIACIGLIDSDKGMFAPYIKNFFKVACTVVVQLLCLKMAMWFMTNLHLIWAIAFCLMASSTPKLMDMILVSNSGGGLGTAVNNVYHVKGLASTLMKKQ